MTTTTRRKVAATTAAPLRIPITHDPRVTIVLAATLVIAALAVPGLAGKLVTALASTLLWASLRLGLRRYLLALAPLSFLFLTTFVLRAVVQARNYPDAAALAWPPGAAISGTGIVTAASLSVQILTIVIALSAAVLSSPPVVLSEATEILLAPMQRLGAPIHEAALMFSIALRFLPIMTDEFRRLGIAQVSRGSGLASGGVLTRTKAVLSLVIPLFIVTLIRARELSEAMDSRGYAGAGGRTRIREYRLSGADYVRVAGVGVLVGAAVAVAVSAGAG